MVQAVSTAPLVDDSAIERSPGYWSTVWRRFRRDPVSMIALGVIVLLILIAILAPYIAPHDPYRGATLRENLGLARPEVGAWRNVRRGAA